MTSLSAVVKVKPSIMAVVIYYHPDETAIKNTSKLAKYLNTIVIDNSEHPSPSLACLPNQVKIITNGHNAGVAKALNQGLDWSLCQGADWCFLFDQDSQASSDFIAEMVHKIDGLPIATAAIVPTYYAENLNKYGDIIQVRKYQISRLKLGQIGSEQFIRTSYAITSGSLVNLRNYQKIGPHDESLFIDFVDIEWGLRANQLGFHIYTNTRAKLIHQLGDEPIILGKRKVVNHSSIRQFYYFRNAIYMLKLKHIPLVWKCYELLKLPIRFTLYSLFSNNRRLKIAAMLSGVWHGINNKTGKNS